MAFVFCLDMPASNAPQPLPFSKTSFSIPKKSYLSSSNGDISIHQIRERGMYVLESPCPPTLPLRGFCHLQNVLAQACFSDTEETIEAFLATDTHIAVPTTPRAFEEIADFVTFYQAEKRTIPVPDLDAFYKDIVFNFLHFSSSARQHPPLYAAINSNSASMPLSHSASMPLSHSASLLTSRSASLLTSRSASTSAAGVRNEILQTSRENPPALSTSALPKTTLRSSSSSSSSLSSSSLKGDFKRKNRQAQNSNPSSSASSSSSVSAKATENPDTCNSNTSTPAETGLSLDDLEWLEVLFPSLQQQQQQEHSRLQFSFIPLLRDTKQASLKTLLDKSPGVFADIARANREYIQLGVLDQVMEACCSVVGLETIFCSDKERARAFGWQSSLYSSS